jgi:dolichyldiphosphatase
MYGKGYGMPSSHAQFVAFFFVSASLFLLVRHVPDHSTNHSPATFQLRAAYSFLFFLGSVAVALSRVYLSYHTPAQVIVGYTAGITFAVFWFLFGTYLRNAGWIDWAVDTQLSQMLRVRDLLVGEDLAEGGWQRWKAVRAQRRANGIKSD